MKPRVFVLVGPTASGKTSLSIELAGRFPLEIVNADSLQVFRWMDIGTAKPSQDERDKTPHHLIDVLDPDEDGTSAWYAKAAREVIADIHAAGKIPLVTGGAGFYLRALEHPPEAEPAVSVTEEVSEEDYALIQQNDPEAAKRIHPNDRYRVARAAALIRKGEKPSERWKAAADKPSPYDTRWIGLDLERAELHERINRRMEEMFERGLLGETDAVRREFPAAYLRLQRAIGYRQALKVLDAGMSVEAAKEEAKAESRQYAKRQITWFRKEPRIVWVPAGAALEPASREIERGLRA